MVYKLSIALIGPDNTKLADLERLHKRTTLSLTLTGINQKPGPPQQLQINILAKSAPILNSPQRPNSLLIILMVKDWPKDYYSEGWVGLDQVVEGGQQEADVFYGAEGRGEQQVRGAGDVQVVLGLYAVVDLLFVWGLETL
jgi:hypothetical protein